MKEEYTRPWQRHYDYNVPLTVRYPRIPVPELLQLPTNVCPHKAAIIYNGKEISFKGFRTQVMDLADALSRLGVKKGDRVGIQLPNCPQYLVSYWATLSLGAIVVNMNPAYPLEEVSMIAKNTGLTTMIALSKTASLIRELRREQAIPLVILVDESKEADSDVLETGWHSFSALIEGSTNKGRRPKVVVSPEDPAVIQFTGGTTGIPKGAVLTHENLVAAVFQASPRIYPITQYIPLQQRSSLVIIPLYHVYGNIVANWAIFNCSTQILVPRFNVDEVIDLLKTIKEVTYFPAVPTMLTALVNSPRLKEIDLGEKIHVINSGAAPCPVELIDRLTDMGVFITEGWGMSETSAVGMSNPVLGIKKPGSIGIPLPGNDVKLVDLVNGTTEVPKGEPGEIIIKGPTVMKEYWNNPEETAKQLVDGWLYTGDIAVQDEDDFFYIVDRKKDMIIAGGFNIYPREVDEVLYRHPDVQDAVTVGVPDDYRGETVKAFVVLREGATATADDIIKFCRERLAPYKVPRLVEFKESLPQSAAGKILRKVLREEEIAKQRKVTCDSKP